MHFLKFLHGFLLALVYAIGFFLLQFFLQRAGIINVIPNDKNLLSWDAGFYHEIILHGYAGDSQRNGFFILFPWLWQLVGGSAWAGVILNTILFSIGFGFLTIIKPQTIQTKLIWLSSPAVFFAFVPYSEAVFFMLGSIALYGIVNQKHKLTFIALILLSLTRATVLVLLPAMIFMQLVGNDRQNWLKNLFYGFKRYVLRLLIGFIIFICY